MASKHLLSQIQSIECLCKIKSKKERVRVLEVFCKDKHFLKAVKEICKNVLNKNIVLTDKARNQLRPHKQIILKLSGKEKACCKTDFVQSGGGFLSVLWPLASLIINQLANGSD